MSATLIRPVILFRPVAALAGVVEFGASRTVLKVGLPSVTFVERCLAVWVGVDAVGFAVAPARAGLVGGGGGSGGSGHGALARLGGGGGWGRREICGGEEMRAFYNSVG